MIERWFESRREHFLLQAQLSMLTPISVSVPPAPQWHIKDSGLQVEHACTLRTWLDVTRHGAWLYGVHRSRRDGSSFMWHQLYQRCKYTTSVDIQKRAVKS